MSKSVKGTKTEKNLLASFAGESQTKNRCGNILFTNNYSVVEPCPPSSPSNIPCPNASATSYASNTSFPASTPPSATQSLGHTMPPSAPCSKSWIAPPAPNSNSTSCKSSNANASRFPRPNASNTTPPPSKTISIKPPKICKKYSKNSANTCVKTNGSWA